MNPDRLTEWKIQQIVRLCHAGRDARALMVETIKRLRALIPLDASFFATVDPATLLFTGSVTDDVLVRATPQFLLNEFLQDPNCALVEVQVRQYRLVRQFQDVSELDMAGEAV